MICNYCKRDYPKDDFKLRKENTFSVFCPMCRDIGETKEKELIKGNFARKLTDKEIELQNRFIEKLSKKDKLEKLPISKGN